MYLTSTDCEPSGYDAILATYYLARPLTLLGAAQLNVVEVGRKAWLPYLTCELFASRSVMRLLERSKYPNRGRRPMLRKSGRLAVVIGRMPYFLSMAPCAVHRRRLNLLGLLLMISAATASARLRTLLTLAYSALGDYCCLSGRCVDS